MRETLTITRPDDWHLHLRDGAALEAVVGHSARVFSRAIVMPNLPEPVTTVAAAASYRARILSACARQGITGFTPLMTLYLTDETSLEEIAEARASGFVHGVKLYPAGATTNSARGVTAIERVLPVLATMAEHDLPLLVHGEVTDPDVDVFARERVFLERVLAPLVAQLPRLRVVLEHVTTAAGVAFVRQARPGVAATITAHHLLSTRNDMLVGGLKPHLYCLPVLKRAEDRRALVEAATSGDPRFFLGTDSAPHPRAGKEAACGCAGCYTAHAALELYAEAFAQAGALAQLEGFASHHGADFYGLPRSTGRVTLERASWTAPDSYPFGQDVVVPYRAGAAIDWRVVDG
ncbi:MAG: dihydroorotase [Myxococcales bacterium]|nr:dihydroorotase [Myxococcales bacterium]